MTLKKHLPLRLTKIDKVLHLSDHSFLTETDQCFFLGEYTAREGHAYSSTNQLIYNLKKHPEKKNSYEWKYKEEAIHLIASYFSQNFGNIAKLSNATLVPLPPSASKEDPRYDDRMLRILKKLEEMVGKELDVRELIVQKHSIPPSRAERLTIAELLDNLYLDERFTVPGPKIIWVFDDIITTGRHFKAAQQLFNKRFPKTKVVGFFVARRVPYTSNISEVKW